MEFIKVELYENNILLATGHSLSERENILYIKDIDTKHLRADSPVSIIIYQETGITLCDGTIYFIVDNMQVNIRLIKRSDIIDRRQHIKIPTDIGTHLFGYTTAEGEEVKFEEPLPIWIKNISIGGMLFSSKLAFKLGDHAQLAFYLGRAPINLDFTIIRTEQKESGNVSDEDSSATDTMTDDENTVEVSYAYGCRFDNLTVEEDTILCSYIYQKQIEMHKKKHNNMDDF